jgi:hypothetical protein
MVNTLEVRATRLISQRYRGMANPNEEIMGISEIVK